MEEFNTGDVVFLNGDPKVQLTVENIDASGDVVVVWFDQDDELQREGFNPLMVHK